MMPYDLFAFALMVISLVLIFRIFIKKIKHKNPIGRSRVWVLVLLVLLIIAIPAFGHMQLNRQLQMKHLLNTFDPQQTLSSTSDKNAVAELSAIPKPMKFHILREEQVSVDDVNTFYNEYIEINGQEFIVTLACYTAPLQWTVFESYSLNQITQ